jgi:predicted P-loop ATPase/GTPase
MNLLVAGGERVDAGKTTFAAGLLAFLRRERGADPRAFKPRAGNDFWFDHDDVLEALGGGRLYGKDAKTLREAEAPPRRRGADAAEKRPPEALNPLHRLWRPRPDGAGSGLLGEPGRTFLVDRLHTPDGDRFVVNGGAELPPVVRETLPLDGERVETVESVEAFNAVMTERYLPAFERLAGEVERADTAVVESYGDIALPLSDVAFDAVAVVEPGRARLYDGRRWVRATEVTRGSPRQGQLEERVGNVTEMVEPVERLPLAPLSSGARGDPAAVADAYADAYEALVAVA